MSQFMHPSILGDESELVEGFLLGSCGMFHLPSSRGTLIGEQPNPWELLHPRDVPSRHRQSVFFYSYE